MVVLLFASSNLPIGSFLLIPGRCPLCTRRARSFEDVRRLAERLRDEERADQPSPIFLLFLGAASGALALLALQVRGRQS